MSRVIRKNICLDSALIEEVNRIVRAKGGLRRGYSFSASVTAALKAYVKQEMLNQQDVTTAPVIEHLMDERFARHEQWLRPGTWGAATYSATAALLLLELMCGKRIQPEEAKDHFHMIRGRAWKLVRRGPEVANTGQTREE